MKITVASGHFDGRPKIAGWFIDTDPEEIMKQLEEEARDGECEEYLEGRPFYEDTMAHFSGPFSYTDEEGNYFNVDQEDVNRAVYQHMVDTVEDDISLESGVCLDGIYLHVVLPPYLIEQIPKEILEHGAQKETVVFLCANKDETDWLRSLGVPIEEVNFDYYRIVPYELSPAL